MGTLNFFQQYIFFPLFMGALLALSAFFSGAETALFSLAPDAVRRLNQHPRIRSLLSILRADPFELLSCILFGNLIVNILFFSTGAAAAGTWGEAHGEWFEALGGLLILLALIVFGEIIPKAIGINHSFAVLRFSARPLRLWFNLTRGFRTVLRVFLKGVHLHENTPVSPASLTAGELKELLDVVRHEPGFGVQEKEILEDIINLSDVRVREMMVPRVRVFRKSMDADRLEILNEARAGEYSHVLVYRDKEDDLLGYICIQDLFFDPTPSSRLDSFIHPLVFIPETKRVDQLLREFVMGGWQLVAVVDEYGGFAGLVTMEDLFEEVVGDFEPEKIEEIVKLDENSYRLQGELSIRAWRELFVGLLPEKEVEALAFDTLGGLVISLLGRFPCVGDSVTVRNLHLTVESIHHRRIHTVLLHLNEPEGIV